LQRLQIIKGWVAADGSKQERVYDVAGRRDSSAGVDLDTCEPTGDPGFASLCSVWQDPEFDAAQGAFYYARAVENPSCRWATQQCVAAKVDCSAPDSVPEGFEDCCNADFPKTIQERAWSSPIWYDAARR